MWKLDPYNFFLLCADCKQTKCMQKLVEVKPPMSNPCSCRIQILQAQNHTWKFENKTNLVALYFYCFNILLELKRNVRRKNKKILQKETSIAQKCPIFHFSKILSAEFFSSHCTFFFSNDQSCCPKKSWSHELRFLVISDGS